MVHLPDELAARLRAEAARHHDCAALVAEHATAGGRVGMVPSGLVRARSAVFALPCDRAKAVCVATVPLRLRAGGYTTRPRNAAS